MTRERGDATVHELPIGLDRSSPVPLYRQLSDQLAGAIVGGLFEPGSDFEAELSLAARLDLSRPTVRRSIAELVERGLLVRHRGVGTTVASPSGSGGIGAGRLGDELTADGPVMTRVLRVDYGERNRRAAEALCVLPSTPLVYLERQRLIDGLPAAYLWDWLPPAFQDITEAEAGVCELEELLRRRGVTPVAAQRTVACRSSLATDRGRLGLDPGAAVLAVTRCLFDQDGRPVGFGDHCYRADRYRFEVTVRSR